jgi:hypothetical protein
MSKFLRHPRLRPSLSSSPYGNLKQAEKTPLVKKEDSKMSANFCKNFHLIIHQTVRVLLNVKDFCHYN